MRLSAKLKCSSLAVFSAWCGVCYGKLLPEYINAGNAGYYTPALCGCLAVAGFSASIMVSSFLRRVMLYVSMVICLGFSLIAFQPLMDSSVGLALWLLTSLASGSVAGLLTGSRLQDINCIYPGLMAAALLALMPLRIMDDKVYNTVFIVLLPLLIVGAMVLAFVYLRQSMPRDAQESRESEVTGRKIWLAAGLYGLYLILEAMVVFWSVVLWDDNQGLMSRLTFPLFLLVLYLSRVLGGKSSPRFRNPGWLFVLSVIIMVSLGYFYTFSINLFFILAGGLGIGLFLPAHALIYDITRDRKQILYLMVILILGLLVSGAYIHNHVAYIKSIGMPGQVIFLSARQAIIKELTALSALGVIGSGILFLLRRKLSYSS